MKLLDIGEVSERAGLTPSTLRYYEEIGLIHSVGRHGLRRQFDSETLLRLSLIALGKSAGFPLSGIKAIFGNDGRPDVPRGRLRERADDLARQIRKLSALEKALRHAAECPAPSHLECPTFRRLLSVATRKRRRRSAGPPVQA